MYARKINPRFSEETLRSKIRRGKMDEMSHAELLAVVIGEGGDERVDVDRSRGLLRRYGSYENLREALYSELCSYEGMDEDKTEKVLCLLEISKRIYESFYNPNPLLDREKKIVEFIKPKIFSSRQEILYILFLSNSLHLKGIIEFARGTDNAVHFYIKELMRVILNGYSSNVVLVHNHIEKFPEASEEDQEVTQKVYERCVYFELRLLDHFVIGREGYVSMRREMKHIWM